MRARVMSVVVLAGLAISAPGLQAHPTAATEVVITLADDGAVRVHILTDFAPMLTKLGVLHGQVASTPVAAGGTDRIRALSSTLVDAVSLFFDDQKVPLVFERAATAAGQPDRLIVSLSARRPAAATRLRWSSSLVFGLYPLVIRRGEARVESEDSALASPNQVVTWLTGAEVSRSVALADVPQPGAFVPIVWIGFSHIVPQGLDHIFFVLGLFLLSRRTRDVLVQVTAFTVAHSVTLGLAIAGVVSVPGAIVEPLIALSIVYIAVENLYATSVTRWRLAVVFGFGLLHGLGFAQAMASLGGSTADLLGSLLAFNAGVEIGQLAVVVGAAGAVALLRVPATRYQQLVVRPASLLIALAGCLWAWERLA